jgi:hypothetical protein
MSQRELLSRIIQVLEGAGVPYMLTGSLASSLQGEPRATHDVDLVIDIDATDSGRVTQALSALDVYVDANAVSEAVRHRSSFNIIDLETGDKADFWLLTDEPYDQQRFARRSSVRALGLDLMVSSPEDTILMKLRWSAKSGGSERQETDARHVYELQAGSLDEAYLNEWAPRLDVQDALARIRGEADSFPS